MYKTISSVNDYISKNLLPCIFLFVIEPCVFWTETAGHGLFCRLLKVKCSSGSYKNLLDRNDPGVCV